MQLFNTLSRKVEPFSPLWQSEGVVTLYTCGPTVYNYLHVGNYRTYVFEDILKRTLKLHGFKVRHVMNITDVGHLTSQADEGEDKLEVGAKREGKTAWQVAEFYTKTFLEDIKALRIDFDAPAEPKREVRREAADILSYATGHIKEQTAMVDALTDKGFTYETSDGIYFDTAKFPGYYKLVGEAHIAGLKEGSRVAMGEKRNGTDFALWKFSPNGEARQMEWDYRGRKGFPGWHIECSAMAKTYLGDTFDIHCGGVDHIPIHHTNEIAQAECSSDKPFVRFWLHGEFLVVSKKMRPVAVEDVEGTEKMSKEHGTFITLADLAKKGFDPLDFRMYCYTAHYRKQLEFSWEALEAARTARRRIREKAIQGLLWRATQPSRGSIAPHAKRQSETIDSNNPEALKEWIDNFRSDLGDDLNVPNAMATLHQALSSFHLDADGLAMIEYADKVLALGLTDPHREQTLPPEIQSLFERYAASRKAKDFKTSDALRAELASKGIKVKDTTAGSTWTRS